MATTNTYIALAAAVIIAAAAGASATFLYSGSTTSATTVTLTTTTTIVTTTTSIPPSPPPAPESGIIIYGVADPEDTEFWFAAFKEKYPGIAIEYVQDRPGNIFTRMVTEVDAGKPTADLVMITLPLQLGLQDEGLLDVYRSPEAEVFPEKFKDPDGRWVAVVLLPVVQVYNTELLSADEVPKTIDELVDPKWKGNAMIHDITLGTTGTNWLGSFKAIIGEEKFTTLIEGLAENVQPVRSRSFSGVPRAAAAGEYAIAITSYMHDLISNKNAGAPIEIFRIEDLPIGTTLLPVSLVKDAQHPIAAKLFIDFILSEEGQRVVGNTEVRIAARPGVDTKYTLETVLPGTTVEDLIIFPNKDIRENIEAYKDLFTRLFAG